MCLSIHAPCCLFTCTYAREQMSKAKCRAFGVEVSCQLVETLRPAPVLWLAILRLCRAIPEARLCIRRMQVCLLPEFAVPGNGAANAQQLCNPLQAMRAAHWVAVLAGVQKHADELATANAESRNPGGARRARSPRQIRQRYTDCRQSCGVELGGGTAPGASAAPRADVSAGDSSYPTGPYTICASPSRSTELVNPDYQRQHGPTSQDSPGNGCGAMRSAQGGCLRWRQLIPDRAIHHLRVPQQEHQVILF